MLHGVEYFEKFVHCLLGIRGDTVTPGTKMKAVDKVCEVI